MAWRVALIAGLALITPASAQVLLEDDFTGPAGPARQSAPETGAARWSGNDGVVLSGEGRAGRDPAFSAANNANLRYRLTEAGLPEGATVRVTLRVFRPAGAKSADWMMVGFAGRDSGSPFFGKGAGVPALQVVQGSGNLKVRPGDHGTAYETVGLLPVDVVSTITWTIDPAAKSCTVSIDDAEPRAVALAPEAAVSFKWLLIRFYQTDPAMALEDVKVEVVPAAPAAPASQPAK